MGKIQDLYNERVRPMPANEQLALAKLILDELADTTVLLDATKGQRVASPKLADPDRAADFRKQVVGA